jgi:hypothetical protein
MKEKDHTEEGVDMAGAQTDVLQSLVNRLREARKEAGDRLGDVLAEASVRERAAAVAEKVEDLRAELTRLVRHGEPPAKPLQDMTARELHQLATKRHIPGRASMNKAELIDALRKD